MPDGNANAPAFTARMVRELKGAPLSILVLLLGADQPVSKQWLENMSGYSDKPVAQALNLLSSHEYQIAVRTYKGWRLADGFDTSLINRRNSVPTTTTLLINKDKENKVVVAEAENLRFMRNLEACKECGIGEPSASQISDLEHVTPEFIRAHKDALVRGETIGLAIIRIKNNEPVAVTEGKSEPVNWFPQNEEHEVSEPEVIPDHVLELWDSLDGMIEAKGKVRAQYSSARLVDYSDSVLRVRVVGKIDHLQTIFSKVSENIQLMEA